MKTQVTDFGFEVLITYLLPGILATGAVLQAHGIAYEQSVVLFEWAKEAQLMASLLLLSSFALFGALIASLQAVFESLVLNWLTPLLLKKNKDQFNTEWEFYIGKLPKNSYISRVVLFFQFETRLGLAAFILGLTLFSLSSLHAIIFLVLGIVFYVTGVLHHMELGEIRGMFYTENQESEEKY